jgi:hypothetical protein
MFGPAFDQASAPVHQNEAASFERQPAQPALRVGLQDFDAGLIQSRVLQQTRSLGISDDQSSKHAHVIAEHQLDVRKGPKPEVAFGRLDPRAEVVVGVVLVSHPHFVSETEVRASPSRSTG